MLDLREGKGLGNGFGGIEKGGTSTVRRLLDGGIERVTERNGHLPS